MMRIFGIIGFGIKINYEDIDVAKYAKATKRYCKEVEGYEDVEDFIIENEVSESDDFDRIIDNSDIPEYLKESISFAHSDDDGDFLLYYPCYPWELRDEEKLLTEDTIVRKAIADILMSIYKDDINREEIEKNIEEINSSYLG